MSTSAQIAANQANAQHSTGPTSQEGKLASSQNNLRHGFTGRFKVLGWESQEEFTDLLCQFGNEHQPGNPYEFALVEKMAQHFWLSQRALSLQEDCFDADYTPAEADKKLSLYLRYQATHERAFRQLSDELRKLRNEKRKAQIGFESQQHRRSQAAFQESNERRKQEMHEARLRLINSQAENSEIDNEVRQTVEAPLPGHMRVPFDTMKSAFQLAVAQVSRDLKKAEAA